MNRSRTEKTAPVLRLDAVRGCQLWAVLRVRDRLGFSASLSRADVCPRRAADFIRGQKGILPKASSCTQWEQNSRFPQELGWGQFDRSQISVPGGGSCVFACDVRLSPPGTWSHRTCTKAPYRSLQCVCALLEGWAVSGVWGSHLFLAVCRGQTNTSHLYNAGS